MREHKYEIGRPYPQMPGWVDELSWDQIWRPMFIIQDLSSTQLVALGMSPVQLGLELN
jgi:hypothetical protein